MARGLGQPRRLRRHRGRLESGRHRRGPEGGKPNQLELKQALYRDHHRMAYMLFEIVWMLKPILTPVLNL